jgi:hypothetical protein
MSDLHLALLLLAAVVLVALYGYGKWQERQALKRMDDSMRGGLGDALLDPQPAPTSAPPATFGPRAQRIEPRLAPLTAEEPAEPAVAEAPAPHPLPGLSSHWIEDPLLDCVLELRCAHAVDGVTVFDAAAPLTRLEFGLPLFLVAWDARTQQWVQPDRFGFYSELLVATQLANRRRALNEIEVSRFIAAVQQVALALDADFDPPEVARIVELAQDLDRLCAQFDVQIGLTLESQGGPWDVRMLGNAAAQAGLMQVADMRWQKLAPAGEADAVPLFTMTSGSLLVDRLSLELDVPLAPLAADPLRALFAAADQLASLLGARIVDDNGRPIHPGSMTAIAEQLDKLYVDLRAAGIEPGSQRAQRLYA